MALPPYPLPRETRETEIRQGDGSATYGPFAFRIFSVEDVAAYAAVDAESDFEKSAVTVTKVNGADFDFFTVTFPAPLPPSARYIVRSERLHERTAAVTKAGTLVSDMLEKELSKQGSILEELRRDADRAWTGDFGQPGVRMPRAGHGRLLGYGDDGQVIVSDTTIAERAERIAADLALRSLIGQAGPIEVPLYDSRLAASLANISPLVQSIRTGGFADPGDGGAAEYARTEIADIPGSFQGADGQWWMLTSTLRTVQMYGAVGDGDHSAAFAAALSVPGYLRVVNLGHAFNLTGTFALASFLTVEHVGWPVINLNASGNERGFWMPHGVRNTHVRGDAVVNLTVNSVGSDGSFNSAFCLGGPFYLTDDPAACDGCSILGNILIDSVGVANGKPVHVYGYAINWRIEGVVATGRTNFAISTHWSGNGAPGVLPTKTWHPDLGIIENCQVIAKAGVPLIRAYSLSGSGRVLVRRCSAKGTATLGYNLFVGDYGAVYAQNITQVQAMQYTLEDCAATEATLLFAVDGISSGLNASPIWAGYEHAARVHFKGTFEGRTVATHVTDLAGVTGVRQFIADNLDITETSAGTGGDLMKISSCDFVEINGRAISGRGPLIRNNGDVEWRCSLINKAGFPVASQYGVSISASSGTTTTTAARVAGDRTLPLDTQTSTVGIGPGTYLKVTISGVTYEMVAKSYLPPNVAGSVTVDPLPVDVPSGTTVAWETCGRSLTVDDCTIDGFSSNVRATGSATARPRNIRIGRRAKLLRWGNICVDLTAAAQFSDESYQDGGGLATSGTKRGTIAGANAKGGRVSIHFGPNNQRIQYGAAAVAGAQDVAFVNGVYESINADSANPAAIFIPASGVTNVTQSGNLVSSGIAPVYP